MNKNKSSIISGMDTKRSAIIATTAIAALIILLASQPLAINAFLPLPPAGPPMPGLNHDGHCVYMGGVYTTGREEPSQPGSYNPNAGCNSPS